MSLVYRGRSVYVYREGGEYRITIPIIDSSTSLTMSEMADLVTAVISDQALAVAEGVANITIGDVYSRLIDDGKPKRGKKKR